MKRMYISKIIFLILLISVVTGAAGCDDGLVRGGAQVVLEGISVGSISTLEGKPVSGLPSQTVNVVLKVATNEVRVTTSGGKTTLKLNPSGATIVISAEGTTFNGIKPDQVELQWQTTPSTTK